MKKIFQESLEDDELIIESVSDYLEIVYSIENDGEIFYRGQSNQNWGIEASLFRNQLVKNEHELYYEIMRKKPFEFKNCENNLERLALMQHYGIPTRLIDITSNPLVALYFACKDELQKRNNGKVFIFKNSKEYYEERALIISNVAFEKDELALEKLQEHNWHQKIIRTNEYVEEILSNKAILVKPRMLNPRIISQQGLFFITAAVSSSLEKKIEKREEAVIDELAFKTMLIKSEKKEEILIELEKIGIKKSFLFPEIEYSAEELINKYKIKPTAIEKKEKEQTKKEIMIDSSEKEGTLMIIPHKYLEPDDRKELKKILLLNIDDSLEKIETLTPKICEAIDCNAVTDWFRKESSKSNMKNIIKRILMRELDGKQEEILEIIMEYLSCLSKRKDSYEEVNL